MKTKSTKKRFTAAGISAALVASAIVPVASAEEAPNTPNETTADTVKVSEMTIGEVVQVGTERFVKYGETIDKTGTKISLFSQISKSGSNANSTVTEQGYNTSSPHFLRLMNGQLTMYSPLMQAGTHRAATTLEQKKETLHAINELYSKHSTFQPTLSINALKNPLDKSDTKLYLPDYVGGASTGTTLSLDVIQFGANSIQSFKDKYKPVMQLPVDLYTAAVAKYEEDLAAGVNVSGNFGTSIASNYIEIQDVQALVKNYNLGLIAEEDMPNYFGLDSTSFMTASATDYISGNGNNVYSNYSYSSASGNKLTKVTQSNPTYTLKLSLLPDTEFVIDGQTASGKNKYKYVADETTAEPLTKFSSTGYSTSVSSDTSKMAITPNSFIVGFNPDIHQIKGVEVLEYNTRELIYAPLAENNTLNFADHNITLLNSNTDPYNTSFTIQAKRNGMYLPYVVWENKLTGETSRAQVGQFTRTGVSKLNTATSTYNFEFDAGDNAVIPLDGIFGEDIYQYTITPVMGADIADASIHAYKNELTLNSKDVGTVTISVKAKMTTSSTNTTKTFVVNFKESTKNAPKLKLDIPDQELNVGDPAVKLNLKDYFETKNPDTISFNVSSSNDAVASARVSAGTDELTITPRGAGVAIVKGTATDKFGTSQEFQFAVTVKESVDINNAPTVDGVITRQKVKVEEEFKLSLANYFKDLDGDNLTYKATVDNSQDADIGVANGELLFIGYEPGNYNVSITANDGKASSDALTFRIVVEEDTVVEPEPTPPTDPTPPVEEKGEVPTPISNATLPMFIEEGNSITLDLKDYFNHVDENSTFDVAGIVGNYASATVNGSALTITGDIKGESLIQIQAENEHGVGEKLIIQAKVHKEIFTTPEIKPSTESGVSNITIIGKDIERTLPLSTQFVNMDLSKTTFEVINSDENLMTVTFDDSTQDLKVTSKEFGFGTVQVKATDENGNKSTFLLLVDIKEAANFGPGTIHNATIQADEEMYIVPLNEVFGTVVPMDNVSYTVGVNKKGENVAQTFNMRAFSAVASLNPMFAPVANASTAGVILPEGVDTHTAYSDGTLKLQIVNNLLVATGTELSQYEIEIQAQNGDKKFAVPFSLTVLKDPNAGTTPPTGGTTPPVDGTTPPTGGTTPPVDGTTPPTGGTTPPVDGTTPPTGGTTPPVDGTTPPTGGTTPPVDGTTPPTGGTTPPVDGTTPPTGGTTPPVDGTAPPTGGTTPPVDGTTPPTGGTTPPVDGTTPPTGGTTPPVDGTTPPTGGTTPGDGTTPPTGGTTPGDGTTPPTGGTNPGDGTPPTGGPSDKVKDVIDSLIVDIIKVDEDSFELNLDGDDKDIDSVDTLIIKEDGIYVTVDGEEVKISEIDKDLADDLNNKRAIRLTKNSISSVMHYLEDSELVLTTKNLNGVLITNKVAEPFIDVQKQDWFHKDVEDAFNYVFTHGTSATTFDPNAEITRGQFAAMIARALEVTDYDTYNKYSLTDLNGKWYADDVQFLVDLGIITGYENGEFGGNDKLTREQAMAILGRTLEHLGEKSTIGKQANITDYSKVSDYAKQYVNYFVENEVLVSGNDIEFNPKENLTRSQMAKVLVRALKLTEQY